MPFKRHTRHDRVLLEDVCRTIDNTTASVDGVMEAPRLVCAFLESWDARQGGIRVKTEDELSMPAEKPGYASDIPAPQPVFFFFVIFRVVISYFIRCNSRERHGWGALSKTVENGVGMTHLFCKHCAAASSQSVGSSSFSLHAARSFCGGLRFLGERKAL